MLARYHIEVTTSALREHFSPEALKAIIAANLKVDNLAGLLGKPWAHFDNNLIREGHAYIERMRAAAAEAAANGEGQRAWTAFGRLTHAAQDFYSHTNYVDRWLEKHGGLAATRPEQISGLEPDLLDEAALKSGDFRLIPDVVYYLPGLAPIARRWFVRAGSHEAMHLDSPERGPRFHFSLVAARQRTLHEYERTLKVALAAGGAAAADCFHGTIRRGA